MSKFFWLISKEKLDQNTKPKLTSICEALIPPNINYVPPRIHISDFVAYGISNPKNNIYIENNSLFIGNFIGDFPEWFKPKSSFPDGTFALFRENEKYSEFVSDPAGSRTIWYYFDDEILIGSTSQLAIVRYLGNFEFNPEAATWMISSGTLGLGNSWDKRIKMLPPDSSVILDKISWQIHVNESKIEFNSIGSSEKAEEKKLKQALNKVFQNLKLNPENWLLPLSGGYDSRCLLYNLKEQGYNLNTVTWGVINSLNDPETDASVAKKLAIESQVVHEFLSTDPDCVNINELINRFIRNGEGRTDNISGYLDGFKIWENFHDKNINGIIRGDVPWASSNIYDDFSARKSVGLILISDYTDLNQIFKNQSITHQIPNELAIKKNENYYEWRDRVYHIFEIPTIIAALADLKMPYVEQSTPLLSRELLYLARNQSFKTKKNKYLFKKIVESYYPNIKFALKNSTLGKKDFLRLKEVTEYLYNQLDETKKITSFDSGFIEKIKESLDSYSGKNQKENRFKLKKILPSWLKYYFKKRFLKKNRQIKIKVDYNELAFRLILIKKSIDFFADNTKK